jgi:hypothetical protein
LNETAFDKECTSLLFLFLFKAQYPTCPFPIISHVFAAWKERKVQRRRERGSLISLQTVQLHLFLSRQQKFRRPSHLGERVRRVDRENSHTLVLRRQMQVHKQVVATRGYLGVSNCGARSSAAEGVRRLNRKALLEVKVCPPLLLVERDLVRKETSLESLSYPFSQSLLAT